jgi:Cof subfamily protein (haloacid dehalogenase superfamily)
MIRLFETRTIRRKRLTKVRCVFCDLDGTLLTNENVVHETVREAMANVQAAGIRIVIASGRTDGFTRLYSSAIDPASPVISLNGALVKRSDGSVLAQHILPEGVAATVEEIISSVNDPALTWSVFTSDGIFSLDERPILPRYLRACKDEMRRVPHLAPFYTNAVSICAAGPYRYIQRISVALARDSGTKLQRVMYQSGSGEDRYYLEISLRSVSKATGVRAVLEELGLSRTRSAAIGDYTNDVEMCTFVGVSAAMRNGNKAIREHADFVTHRNNDEGGAADFFRMLLGQRSGR